MQDLEVCLLGQFQVNVKGQAVTNFASDKVRALLAYLATEVQCPHRREILADLLWPEKTEKMARANLRRGLADLRQVIGDQGADPPFLLISRQDIQFNPEASSYVDIHALNDLFSQGEVNAQNIEEFESILRIYQGDFLAGFGFPGSLPFDEWALVTREKFSRRAISVLSDVSAFFEGNQEFGKALPYVWRQIELEPWQEGSRRRLMRLLVNLGRRDEALQQYHALEKVLSTELDVDPAPQTQDLFSAIKNGEMVSDRVGEEPVHARPITPPTFLRTEAVAPQTPSEVFVSRQPELVKLHGWLNTCMDGQGRAAFISGVAGSGKTLLVREFVRQAQTRHPELISVTGYCNAFTGAGDPYLPFRDILIQLSGDIKTHWKAGAFDRNYSLRLWNTIPTMCNALVRLGPDLIDVLIPGQMLMENLVAFAEENPPWFQELSTLVEKKQKTGIGNVQQFNLFTQVVAVIQEVAKTVPILLVVEDLHWADAGTVGILFHLGKHLSGSPILLAGAYRPEEVEVQKEGAQHPVLPLLHEFKRDFGDTTIKLDETANQTFVRDFLDSEPHDFDDSFISQIETISGGHALFTVEIMRSLQEDGFIRKDQQGRWRVEKEFNLDTIPPKIEGIIEQRINRTSPEQQQILTIAGVEGERFTAGIAAVVAEISENQVVNILSQQLDRQHRLVRAEQVIWQDQKTISRYRFRHILFQKYLYNQLDNAELAGLHASVGNAIENMAGDRPDRYAVQLARHFHEANQIQKAAQYYQIAGGRAAQISGHIEAIGLFEKALKLLFSLPESSQRDQQELGLQLQIGLSHQATKGFGYPALGQAYGRAWELCQMVGRSEQVLNTLQLLYSYYMSVTEFDIASELLSMMDDLYDTSNNYHAVQFHWGYGYIDSALGRSSEALVRFEKALTFYDLEECRPIAETTGLEAGIYCNGWAAIHKAIGGFPDQAVTHIQKIFEIAEHFNPAAFNGDQYWFSVWASVELKDFESARRYAEEGLAMAVEHNFLFAEALAKEYWGRLSAHAGRYGEAIENIQHGLEIMKMIGMIVGQVNFLHNLAEAYCLAGEIEDGLDYIYQAEKFIEDTGEARYQADVYRIKGELLIQAGDEAGAEEAFLSAISVAQEQGARMFELEATKPLARLWQRQGKTAAALEMLREIYDWFTEGFNTPMLVEANTLLEELESSVQKTDPVN